ncbi:SUCROSE SYNTHASE [Salix purpurea]|uniref:sucrose synthase n=1 Tax=Salix purpurea TaxID=77065 RepID=A0A9Q0ZW50_SALPP|nr:SUCROSE SYNTHASE [Salix purpurea]
MARLDTVKNITGLTEWFGKNTKLRNLVDLVVVAGFFDPSKSNDREEIAEIKKMHALIEKYQLKGQYKVSFCMNCGLPTFATDQGGPAKILVDGISGFNIDPNDGDVSSNKIADFFEKCKTDAGYWNKMSAECSKCDRKRMFQSQNLHHPHRLHQLQKLKLKKQHQLL